MTLCRCLNDVINNPRCCDYKCLGLTLKISHCLTLWCFLTFQPQLLINFLNYLLLFKIIPSVSVMLTFKTFIFHIFKKRDTTVAIYLFYVYVLLLFKLHHTTNHLGGWASFKIQLHNFSTFSWEVMPCKKLDTNIMT